MKKAKFICPVVTAFDAAGNLDVAANTKFWDELIACGIDGILLMGSIGEFSAMTPAMKKELADLAVTHIAKRVKLYIGTASMVLTETIAFSNYVLEKGADAVMVISPYYFAISDAAVEYWFDQIADGVRGNVYLYNFPARTGYDLSPEVTLKLLRKHKNIVGYKDSVAEMGHTRKLAVTVLPEFPDFEIYSGFDENFVHNILSGGSGCIGGFANIVPELCAKWVTAINGGDWKTVEDIQLTINTLMDIYFIGNPFIPIIKKAMILRGYDLKDVSLNPFLPATAAETAKIKEILAAAKLS